MSLFNKHLCYVKGGKKLTKKVGCSSFFQTVKTVENFNTIPSTTDTDLFFLKMKKKRTKKELHFLSKCFINYADF